MMEREFKDSGIEWIGRIPKEWKTCRLKDCASLVLGKMLMSNPPSSHANKYTLECYLKSKNIGWLELLLDNGIDEMWFNEEEKKAYLLNDGDIVMNEGGDIGKIALWHNQPYPCYIQNSVHKIVPQKTFNNVFLQYAIYVASSKGYLQSIVNQISIAHLTKEKLQNTPIVFPPLPEQQRIADYLDKKCGEIDELIALQEQMIAQLTDYKQSVITEAVTKGLNPNAELVPSGIDWIGDVPKGWKVCRFKSIAAVKANLVSPDLYLDYPQVAPDNIEKGSGKLLSWKKVKEAGIISDNHLFFKGQIVYSKIRPMLNKVIIAPFDGLCSADMYPIETKLVSKYLLYYMLSSLFTQQVQRYVNDRVKMPKINKEEIANILTIIPSESEQHTIATYLDTRCSEIDSLIAIKQQKIETLKDYKKSVIYEAVTGKMTV